MNQIMEAGIFQNFKQNVESPNILVKRERGKETKFCKQEHFLKFKNKNSKHEHCLKIVNNFQMMQTKFEIFDHFL